MPMEINMAQPNKVKSDPFARIAAQRAEHRESALIEPGPQDLPDVVFSLDSLDPDAVFKPAPRLDTLAKLKVELARQRRLHAKYLRNLAPEPDQTRAKLHLKHFDWRIQTDADLSDFTSTVAGAGNWEKVTIPHYGPPLGRAATYYRNEFDVTAEMLARGAIFICFNGVDYKAHVFVNGSYAGSHEGFFAPFDFEITNVAHTGKNTLLVKVENDAVCMSNDSWGDDGALYEGDKIYAATGPGYDEPVIGWHHCPPGMGIYQSVYIEARPKVFISDIFIRPILDESRAEAWVEVYSCHTLRQDIRLKLSVYGQNFKASVVCDKEHELPGPVGPGINYFRLPFDVPNPRIWDTATPWLYQAQVHLFDKNGAALDTAGQQFGMRSFKMDEDCEPKGRFYLNGREIRLRGANTMGFEQQDVMRGDHNRLIDDILLAKICNINFFRLTQRPVQPEVYDYCDQLGLMTQTDLPLFGVLRRNQFVEAVRQAGEMEKLVRSHPCNVVSSYINEPFPNAWDKPQRHLTRSELESFFTAAGEMVHLINPDRVIKPVDGDYDPPAPGLPDNHCYNGWYNGHGLDIGKLHKGYWQHVKPDWMYGCGEFGAEGLDPVDTMRKYYPADWLPQTPRDERDWTPNNIPQAQTGRFHYMWFDTQHTLKDWVGASQDHQAQVTRLMTDAFRRDNRMNSFAIHLFIDAFPSGWMKAIMDIDRNPKSAYFAYREALTPLAVALRTDRHTYFARETADVEVWACNDTHNTPADTFLHYQLEMNGRTVYAKRLGVDIPVFASACLGHLCIPLPDVEKRTHVVVRTGIFDASGKLLHESSLPIRVLPAVSLAKKTKVVIVGLKSGNARKLVNELDLKIVSNLNTADTILIDDYNTYLRKRTNIMRAVENGAYAVFLELPVGEYEIENTRIKVDQCGMGERHFVSRNTGHTLVKNFEPGDFKFWYEPENDRIAPLLSTTFVADGWDAILSAGNGDWASGWTPALAAAEKNFGKGKIRICQVHLAGMIVNPVARCFAASIMTEC